MALCLFVVSLSGAWSCGGSDIKFGGGGEDEDGREIEEITVEGTVDDVLPLTTRDQVVFVFTDLQDPGTFQDFKKGQVGLVAEKKFLITGIAPGDLTVVFLLDQPGIAADGAIDPGDPVAVLDDPDGRLKDRRNGDRIVLRDVDIDFNEGTATVRDTDFLINPPSQP